MTSPLEGAIRRTMGKAMRSTFYRATLICTTPGAPDPDRLWIIPHPVEEHFPCRAVVDAYSAFLVASGVVSINDVKVIILTDSLKATPKLTDVVSVRGKTYTILNIETDPALATWVLRASG